MMNTAHSLTVIDNLVPHVGRINNILNFGVNHISIINSVLHLCEKTASPRVVIVVFVFFINLVRAALRI